LESPLYKTFWHKIEGLINKNKQLLIGESIISNILA